MRSKRRGISSWEISLTGADGRLHQTRLAAGGSKMELCDTDAAEVPQWHRAPQIASRSRSDGGLEWAIRAEE